MVSHDQKSKPQNNRRNNDQNFHPQRNKLQNIVDKPGKKQQTKMAPEKVVNNAKTFFIFGNNATRKEERKATNKRTLNRKNLSGLSFSPLQTFLNCFI